MRQLVKDSSWHSLGFTDLKEWFNDVETRPPGKNLHLQPLILEEGQLFDQDIENKERVDAVVIADVCVERAAWLAKAPVEV